MPGVARSMDSADRSAAAADATSPAPSRSAPTASHRCANLRLACRVTLPSPSRAIHASRQMRARPRSLRGNSRSKHCFAAGTRRACARATPGWAGASARGAQFVVGAVAGRGQQIAARLGLGRFAQQGVDTRGLTPAGGWRQQPCAGSSGVRDPIRRAFHRLGAGCDRPGFAQCSLCAAEIEVGRGALGAHGMGRCHRGHPAGRDGVFGIDLQQLPVFPGCRLQLAAATVAIGTLAQLLYRARQFALTLGEVDMSGVVAARRGDHGRGLPDLARLQRSARLLQQLRQRVFPAFQCAQVVRTQRQDAPIHRQGRIPGTVQPPLFARHLGLGEQPFDPCHVGFPGAQARGDGLGAGTRHLELTRQCQLPVRQRKIVASQRRIGLGKRGLRYTRKTGARFVTVRIDRDRGLVQFACAATIASGEMSTRQRECRLLA